MTSLTSKMFKPKFILLAAVLSNSLALSSQAKSCKSESVAADYKCRIKDSTSKIDIKYRYNKFKNKSVSLNYLTDKKGPYARETFSVKTDSASAAVKKPNCLVFGLIGKCIRKKIKVCDSVLTASHSETLGLFNKYKYKRVLSFDTALKKGSYTYLRKTPKASPTHRLHSFKVAFDNCKLVKKY